MDRSSHVAGAVAAPEHAYDADIIILALDRASETEAAIASALAQQDVSRHVFVVDQGSHPKALARLARAVEGRADATLVSTGGNLGVARGRNLGATLGHGRIIISLDNDAEFAGPDTVRRAVAAMDAEPDIGALGFRIVEHAGGRDDLSSWGYPTRLLPRAAESFDAVTFVGAGHAMRRAAWDAAGGYDPALFFCWEEYDFCLRAVMRGWRVRYRGDIVVRHKVSAERRMAWSGARWFQFVRNRLYIERKCGASWLALAPRVIGYAVKGVRQGYGLETARAVAAAAQLPVPQAQPLSTRARDYLRRNDRAHRGSVLHRLRSEVLASLP